MSIDISPFEGKIVLLCYTECDYEGEGNACLVYQVEEGILKPLYGVMDLPQGTFWNHDNRQYLKALAIIKNLGVNEVYIPWYSTSVENFFGAELGYQELTEELNAQNEIECWCELGTFLFDWEMISLLEECQIKVVNIHPLTMEVVE